DWLARGCISRKLSGGANRRWGRQDMSFLTQMPVELYAADATTDFKAADGFDLGTARALAWMSQLAYETDFDKIAAICAKMKIARIGDPIHRGVATGL